jgi:hypothetical protein
VKSLSTSKPELVPIRADIDLLLDSGVKVKVRGVDAARNPRTRQIYFDPVSALLRYYNWTAREAGLEQARDAALLSLLVAPIGGVEVPWVLTKYRLNKMLFYQWQRALAVGLGEAFPHDEFVAERKGPVPVHIEEDLERLESDGLIRITRHDPEAEKHEPWVIELTELGKERGRKFLDTSETWFRRATIGTKRDLLLLNPAKLRARVHSEYPKYRRKYVEVDDS